MGTAKGKVLPFKGRCDRLRVTDLDLLWGVAMGDNSSLRDLFYRRGDLIFRIFRVDFRFDTRMAGALLRDTFLEVWRSANVFDGRLSALGWIVRVAVAMGERVLSVPSLAAVAFDVDSAAPTQGEGRWGDGAPILLEAFVAELPWEVRMAVVLIERERMKAMEVADALRVNPRVVWRWVARGRSQTCVARLDVGVVRRKSRLRRALATGKLCPPDWVLNREASGEIAPRVHWHLSDCIDCSRKVDELFRMSVQLRALPCPDMSEALKSEIAVTLLTTPISASSS